MKIPIDRSHRFDPSKFIDHPRWDIWRGPADGDGLHGEEEQDVRSTSLTEVDLSRNLLVSVLIGKETSIKGEERLSRLKQMSSIRLDAKVFQTLWYNQHLIPERWKAKVQGHTQRIFCDGTTLRRPSGGRYALFFYWCDEDWLNGIHRLDFGFDQDDVSAVIF